MRSISDHTTRTSSPSVAIAEYCARNTGTSAGGATGISAAKSGALAARRARHSTRRMLLLRGSRRERRQNPSSRYFVSMVVALYLVVSILMRDRQDEERAKAKGP